MPPWGEKGSQVLRFQGSERWVPMRTLLGQEGPVPADAPLGEMTVPAGMLLWRAGSGSPGIPPRCVAGESREARPRGREGTDAGLERPRRLLPAAGHVPRARTAGGGAGRGGAETGTGPPCGLRFRQHRPGQSERGGSEGPRPR